MPAKGNLVERPGTIRLNRRGELALASALVEAFGCELVCLLAWLNSLLKSYRRHVSCFSLSWACSTLKMRKEFYVATPSTFDNTWAISGRRYLAIFKDRRQVSAFAIVHK